MHPLLRPGRWSCSLRTGRQVNLRTTYAEDFNRAWVWCWRFVVLLLHCARVVAGTTLVGVAGLELAGARPSKSFHLRRASTPAYEYTHKEPTPPLGQSGRCGGLGIGSRGSRSWTIFAQASESNCAVHCCSTGLLGVLPARARCIFRRLYPKSFADNLPTHTQISGCRKVALGTNINHGVQGIRLLVQAPAHWRQWCRKDLRSFPVLG